MPPTIDPSAHQAPLAWWNESLHGLQAGVDEAGRGPLAGPVVAAAVILDARDPIDGLDDSKKLTPARRAALDGQIRARALCFAVAEASVEEIDRLNILQATLLAMRRAVQGLRLRPGRVLVDGNRVPVLDVLAEPVIGGDTLVPAISAASILAKVHRDRWCVDFHREYPLYGFDAHKGYGTAVHMEALRRHGPCPQHRRSFAPVREADRLALLRQGGTGTVSDAPARAAAPIGRGAIVLVDGSTGSGLPFIGDASSARLEDRA